MSDSPDVEALALAIVAMKKENLHFVEEYDEGRITKATLVERMERYITEGMSAAYDMGFETGLEEADLDGDGEEVISFDPDDDDDERGPM